MDCANVRIPRNAVEHLEQHELISMATTQQPAFFALLDRMNLRVEQYRVEKREGEHFEVQAFLLLPRRATQ